MAADLHLEKGSSLARQGWFLPPYDSADTLARLLAAVERTGASRLVLLGDSFHDEDGPARLADAAVQLLQAIAARVRIIWVAGNHDGVSPAMLPGAVVEELWLAGIRLLHIPDAADARPQLAGHFHPKVQVPLRGGRSVSRRCLALGARRGILPAYGAYAGGLNIWSDAITAALDGAGDAVIATDDGLLRLSPPGFPRRAMRAAEARMM